MSQSREYESFDLPGIGETRAVVGTSTHVMAGAIRYWHEKYRKEVEEPRKMAFFSGMVCAAAAIGAFELAFHLLRSL